MALAKREDEQIAIRVPVGLRERIKAAAAENYRSMNSELISQLERLYPKDHENKKADARA